MAHSYAHLFDLPITMFRFFTVYGPWGRPDMALFKFTKAILNGDTIDVYNRGEMSRDFTYIDDLINGIRLLIDSSPAESNLMSSSLAMTDSKSSVAPFRVVNIGNSKPTTLLDVITAIEDATGVQALKNLVPMQPGDVNATWADTSVMKKLVGYQSQIDLTDGVTNFGRWYKEIYDDRKQ